MEEINNNNILFKKSINLFPDEKPKNQSPPKKEKCKTPTKKKNIYKSALTYINKNNISDENEQIIKTLSKIIDLNPSKNISYNYPKYNTSYKIFQSEVFNIDTLMYYLSTRDQIGVTDELINFLYAKFQNDSLFYIPQFCCFLTYKKYITPIENYLLDSCVDRMKFSLTTFWMTYANENSENLEKLQQNIVMTLVNNRRHSLKPNKNDKNKYNKNNIYEFQKNVIQESLIKEPKLNYFDYVFNFYDNLKNLCKVLKDTSKSDRDDVLKKNLMKYNRKIKNEKKKSQENIPQVGLVINYFYEGILLPFNDDIDTSDKSCSIIVNFVPELSMCYHSKARVPILLTVECVKLYEIQEFYEKKKKDEEYIHSFNSINDFLKDFGNENKNKKEDENDIKNIRKIKRFKKIEKFEDDFYIYIPDYDLNPKIYEYFDQKYSNLIKEKKAKSRYKDYDTYFLKSFIFKSNDDLRQELLTLQLIKKLKMIYNSAGLHLKLFPYEILITSKESGIIEFLPNTISIDQLKKKYPNKDLNLFFRDIFEKNFEIAQKNFCESLAAYSIICYLLEIRDRHNGNILIDMYGNLIHIDFGFILGIGPGGKNFEQAPFKLTEEYVKILDGLDSPVFQYFETLLYLGFIEARKHFDTLWKIIEITYRGNPDLPCFKDRDIDDIKDFFENKFLFDKPEIELAEFVEPLIKESYANGRTSQYDTFQYITNGID